MTDTKTVAALANGYTVKRMDNTGLYEYEEGGKKITWRVYDVAGVGIEEFNTKREAMAFATAQRG